ncbi:MAG: (Fe-S)-binding protein [Candidatus Zixiibacteriota bacterium]|nr:MAG: (Fe-S)-binding protein [candidate division Zixibacteria bacterium]
METAQSNLQALQFGIIGKVILFLLLVISVTIFLQRVVKLIRLMKLGQPENSFGSFGKRLTSLLKYVFGQRRLLMVPYPGIAHFFIFWGFIFVVIGYITTVGQGFYSGFGLPLLDGVLKPYYLSLLDLFQLLVIVAVLMALYRRLIWRPPGPVYSAGANVLLFSIFAIMVFDLVGDGFKIAIAPEGIDRFSFASSALAALFSSWGVSSSVGRDLYFLFWWAHLLVILFLLDYVPYSKHLHILTAPFNVFFRNLGPRGQLTKMDLEESESIGVNRIEDFSRKGILDLYTCTECGRCDLNCPAHLSEKPLSPKDVILNLQHHLLGSGEELLKSKAGAKEGESEEEKGQLIGPIVEEEALWSCTTCYGCVYNCPVFIEHIDKIVDMRRYLVLSEGKAPPEAATTLRNLERNQNPWGLPQSSRTDWIEGLDIPLLSENREVEYLFWVGCSSSLDARNTKIAVAFAKILKAAGVSFGILGEEENCCGDPARRMGDEYQFQTLVETNLEILKNYGVRKILTICPHGFNTFKYEYPQFGGDFEVRHHSEFVRKLISENRLSLKAGLKEKVTYHDSCYLGRYNDIYESPRQILKSLTNGRLTELPRRKGKSFCCGAGGGRMFMEEDVGKRVNDIRTQEILDSGAEVVASACPFCLTMLSDGIKDLDAEERLKIFDIAELVSQSLEL